MENTAGLFRPQSEPASPCLVHAKRACKRGTIQDIERAAAQPALLPSAHAADRACARTAIPPPIPQISPATIPEQVSSVAAAMTLPAAVTTPGDTPALSAAAPAADNVSPHRTNSAPPETDAQPASGSSPPSTKPSTRRAQKQVLKAADASRRKHSERIDLYTQLMQASIRASEASSAAVHASLDKETPGLVSDAVQRQVAKCQGHVDGLGQLADTLEAWLAEHA